MIMQVRRPFLAKTRVVFLLYCCCLRGATSVSQGREAQSAEGAVSSHFPCASDPHMMSLTACCFDPDSQKVASVSFDRSIKIWDVTSQTTLLTITK